MLSAEEKLEIEAECACYERRTAAAPEALKIVQRRSGWVSDTDLIGLAEYLQMTPAELDSVATFFNLIFRRPVGRHVIFICDSVSCWIMGYHELREQLTARLGINLGETTPDGRFTLLPIACLGACDQAPAMMIDGELHGLLTAEKVDEILSRYE